MSSRTERTADGAPHTTASRAPGTPEPAPAEGSRVRTPWPRRWWPTRVAILVAFVLPLVTELPYDPAETSQVIAEVLGDPLIAGWFPGQVVLQVLLGLVMLIPFVLLLARPAAQWQLGRVVLAAYAAWLLLTGLLQNMADTATYGFAWVVGNSVVSLIVCGFVVGDVVAGKSSMSRADLTPRYLWMLLPAALPFLSPYAVTAEGTIIPGFQPGAFGVQAGITYCFLTPVVIAVLLSFARGVDRGTLSIIGFAGLGFGAFNLVTWFVLAPASWWMGVLHLPLVILSVVALVVGRRGSR